MIRNHRVNSNTMVSATMVSHTETVERGAWGGKLEFLLTCIGYSVGLGNIWRFPYLTYENGGGAFILPYLIFLVFVGLPMYTMELCFGQFASLGPTAIWKASPLFKGIGFAALTISWYIMIYFNVIISWILFYLFSCFQKTLPWTTCDNHWNTPACLVKGVNVTFTVLNKTPSEEFYYREVLERSDGIEFTSSLNWRLTLLLVLSWIIIFLVMLKGVSSLGKVSYVAATFPYILLTVFLIRGVTLPGAERGILYYITPDFEKLKDPNIWTAAATQIFYSTGVCMGSLIAMSSYNKFNTNVLRHGIVIPLINSATSIYSGFVIFCVLGYMAQEQGMEVPDVVAQGPGLVFVVYPEGLSTMPLPQLWNALFFIMMTFIGYSSQFSVGETVISAFQDEFTVLRNKPYDLIFRASFCFFGFLCGLPMVTDSGFYIFSLLNDYSAGYPLLVIGLMELLAINYVYGFHNFAGDILLMTGRKPNIFLKFCWMIFTPTVIVVIIIFLLTGESSSITVDGARYPQWGFTLAWLIAGFPLALIFLVGLVAFCRKGGYQALVNSVKSEKGWGPAKPENRKGRYERTVSRDESSERGVREVENGRLPSQYRNNILLDNNNMMLDNVISSDLNVETVDKHSAGLMSYRRRCSDAGHDNRSYDGPSSSPVTISYHM